MTDPNNDATRRGQQRGSGHCSVASWVRLWQLDTLSRPILHPNIATTFINSRSSSGNARRKAKQVHRERRMAMALPSVLTRSAPGAAAWLLWSG